MKKKHTNRGFSLYEFKDRGGNECSLQKSSIATEQCIWLGANETIANIGMPWQKITEKEIKEKFNANEIITNSRMHLTQKQVKKLLPILTKFAETGEI